MSVTVEIKNRFTGEVVAKIESFASLYVGNKDYQHIQLPEVVLNRSDFSKMDMRKANFCKSVLSESIFSETDLRGADLSETDLSYCNFTKALLSGTNFKDANCNGAIFDESNLSDAIMVGTRCSKASFVNTNITGVFFKGASLYKAKGLYKVMGVEPGNTYWKRFSPGLKSSDGHFQYKLGLNILKQGFASDDQEMCSFPGFHFGSKSWCSHNYPNRKLEAKIRIPEGAKINEPYATNGTASSDMIDILQVFDSKTGEDITDKFKDITVSGKIRYKSGVKYCG